MRTRLRRLAIALAIVGILLCSALADLTLAFEDGDSVAVDVFTQREPYSGRGMNMASDAFGPEDVVTLYALVTCNNASIENMVVAFNVKVPNDAHFTISARTNASGLAMVNFTILTPPINISESDVFGSWFVSASVLAGGQVFQDTLTFKVDWIVKLLSVRTVDESLTYRDGFGRGGDVGLEITLRSIAMTLRNATVAVVIKDELDVPVNFSMIKNFAVQPNEKVVRLFYKATLPTWALVGTARAYVTALTAPVAENGVPYCPSIFIEFSIKGNDPLKIDYHDATAVIVLASPKSVIIGQGMSLKTIVRNEGTVLQIFSVSTFFDDVLFGTFNVTNLMPYAVLSFSFVVNASLLSLGNHTISAHVPLVAGEADLTDNDFEDTVEVMPKPPVIIHDIGITGIAVSNTSVFIGDTLRVNVTVLNEGSEAETFNVSAFYDSSVIGTILVSALAPSSQATLAFNWDTKSVKEGSYQLSAYAPLRRDANTSDNTFIGDIVHVTNRPQPQPTHDVALLTVHPQSNLVYIGESLEILATVENMGDVAESFNVTAYYNSSTIGTVLVSSLASGVQKVLVFQWVTQDVAVGNYTISAVASAVAGEQNLDNNRYVDGLVQVIVRPPTATIHDVAVLNVVPLSRFIYIGDVLDVNVTVKNKGNYTESFEVVLYYDTNSVAGTLQVVNLAAGAENILVFHWTTSGVKAGNHTISAVAKQVKNETLTDDNKFVDGTVKFATSPSGLVVPDWFYWFMLLLLLLLLFLLIIFWYYRRRKESKASFYAGWTAWYYAYDPTIKPRKT